MEKAFFVYILTNSNNRVLYTGVTSDLKKRVYEHRNNLADGFTKRYKVHKLVWFEAAGDSYGAIAREKQIKAGSRARKVALIDAMNPGWRDLYDEI